MQNDLHDKHVVVTGGTGGLGVAVVTELLERGAICHVPCFESEVPNVELDSDRLHFATSIDLTSEVGTRDYFATLPPLWGSVHLAGGFAMSAIADTSLAEVERMWRLNTVATFLCCREAVLRMRGAGGGRIVNVTARPALEPVGGMVAYSMSKAAVAALTESLARELVAEEISVVAIVPAIIDTPANRAAMPDAEHESWPKPAQLAEVIAFAIAPGSALLSGALIPVYGKML